VGGLTYCKVLAPLANQIQVHLYSVAASKANSLVPLFKLQCPHGRGGPALSGLHPVWYRTGGKRNSKCPCGILPTSVQPTDTSR